MFDEVLRQKLRRFEGQMALAWRLWLHVRRFVKLIPATSFKQLPSLFQIAKMFIAQRLFTATNRPRYLVAATNSYFSLREIWLGEEADENPLTLEISGWATPNEFIRLRNLFTQYKMRRVFRPDVWYLAIGKLGLFSGFRIQAPVSSLPEILEALGHGQQDRYTFFSIERPNILANVPFIQIDAIVPKREKGALGLYSTFAIAPIEFTNLIESAVDRPVAELLLSALGVLYQGNFNGDSVQCAAKLCLIVDHVPSEIRLNGWELCNIVNPDWRPSLSFTGGTKSNVQNRYFIQKDVEIQNGGTLLHNKGFLNWDPAQHPTRDFVAGNWDSVIGSNANLRKCFVRNFDYGRTFQHAIILSSRVDSNWFHFLVETLPRLFLVDEHVDPAVPILVSDRIPPTGLEALKLITDRRIIQVSALEKTNVANAFVPGPVIYHPDTQFLWDQVTADDFNLDALRKLRDAVLSRVDHPNLKLNSYWIRPGNHRVITNPKAVSRLLERYGFQIEDPSSLDFASQVALIYASKNLVIIGGATMANFIFANEDSSITVLTSKFGQSYGVPIILGSVSGATIEILPGKRKFHFPLESVISRSHRSFKVRLRALKTFLDSRIND